MLRKQLLKYRSCCRSVEGYLVDNKNISRRVLRYPEAKKVKAMTRKMTGLNPINAHDKLSSAKDKEQVGKQYNMFYVYKFNNYLNKLFGLQKITYDGETHKAIGGFAKLYALLIISLIITEGYFLIGDLKNRNSVQPIIVVIDILSNVCVTITTIVSILISAFLVSPFMLRALQGFGPIDEKLGIKGNQNYIFLRRRIMLAQFALLVFTVCHLIYEDYTGVIQWNSGYRAITMHLIDLSVYVQVFDFATVIWIIVTRFKMFNSQLAELVNEENELDKIFNEPITIFPSELGSNKVSDFSLRTKTYSQTKINEKNKSQELMRLMKVFDELADVANIVSSCYGLSILFTSTTTFLYIISTVNGLIMYDDLLKEDSHHTIPYIIGWCLPDTVYLVTAAYISEMMKNEVEKTNSYIDKLTINTEHGTKDSELIENFVQLLSVREVFVTASNFFPFDMTFVLSLVGAVATYTVLLMQVKPLKDVSATNSTIIGNCTNCTTD